MELLVFTSMIGCSGVEVKSGESVVVQEEYETILHLSLVISDLCLASERDFLASLFNHVIDNNCDMVSKPFHNAGLSG